MKFEQALKLARRNVFVHGDAWRTAIICPDQKSFVVAWDEAKAMLEASSIRLEEARYATRTMRLERGAIIRFFVVDDLMDAYLLAGHMYTHMMFLHGDYPPDVLSYLRPMLRSTTLESDKLVWTEYVTL